MSDGVDGYVLAGERRVEYCMYNRGANHRAVFQYGTPGTRWLSPQLIGAARAAGFELLVIDRPGYGMTGRRPGRQVVDVVSDVHAVVEAVGWDHFRGLGWLGRSAARIGHRRTAGGSRYGMRERRRPGSP